MHIQTYIPVPALQPYVKHFLVIGTEQAMENRILPDTAAVMAFRLQGQTAYNDNGTQRQLPSAAISGLRKTSRFISYAANSTMLLVVFREGGAAAFFREPLYELYDQSVPLDCFIAPQSLAALEEQMAAATGNQQKVALVEQFLITRLGTAKHDLLIAHAIAGIKAAQGNLRIKELVSNLHISRDPFEKRFRKATGTSPKQFAAITRLRHIIDTYPQARNFTDAAYHAGYFDQAHFIRDFRLFTGQAPHDFFSSVNWW